MAAMVGISAERDAYRMQKLKSVRRDVRMYQER